MACECSALGLDEMFNERTAAWDVRRFRRRGLPTRARRLLTAIERSTPLGGATSLEIGAGAGGLTITMLQHALGTAETVDASPAFATAASTLAREYGVGDRMHIVVGDFAADPTVASDADIVVLDRVICCYPGLEELLRPAADRARRTIALTYPRPGWLTRRLIGTLNAGQALLRRRFRMHYHPPRRVHALLREQGFEPAVAGHVGIWEITVAMRNG